MDGIFEFADMYTLGVGCQEYIDFLWKLFWRIAEGNPPDNCTWKQDSDIFYRDLREEDEPSKRSKRGRRKKAARVMVKQNSRLMEPTASTRAYQVREGPCVTRSPHPSRPSSLAPHTFCPSASLSASPSPSPERHKRATEPRPARRC